MAKPATCTSLTRVEGCERCALAHLKVGNPGNAIDRSLHTADITQRLEELLLAAAIGRGDSKPDSPRPYSLIPPDTPPPAALTLLRPVSGQMDEDRGEPVGVDILVGAPRSGDSPAFI
jgi:hypothetical protein